MRIKEILAFVVLLALFAFKDDQDHRNQYIEEYAAIAQYYQDNCGIPASIQIAQAIYESGGGISDVANASHNHFGIRKFKGDYWKGETYTTPKGTVYRKYHSPLESWDDHAYFLHKHYILAVGHDWKHWVKWCKGYGGHPDYWGELGKIIEQNQLYRYDRIDNSKNRASNWPISH